MSNASSQLVDVVCVVCGAKHTRYVLTKMPDAFTSVEVKLYCCLDCQTVFLADWRNEFVSELYNYYSERIGASKESIYNPINEIRYVRLLKEFNRWVNGKRLLDVGCGQGQFVDFLVRQKWNVLGIELSDAALKVCEQFSLPVCKFNIFDAALSPNTFDVITLFEVIEHVPSAGQFLNRAAQLLKPGGLMYLTTPNFNSLERKVMGAEWSVIHPEHVNYFVPYTLTQLIKRYTNLEIIYIRTRNISISSIRQKISWARNKMSSQMPAKSERMEDQKLREQMEASALMKFGKWTLNHFLNLFGSGSTMIALCRKTKR